MGSSDWKVLTLSTAHLTVETAAYLKATDCLDWPTLGGPYGGLGWLFHVDEDAASEEESEVFEDLYRVFRFAAANDYAAVLFYDIEEPIDELPVYREFEDECDTLLYNGGYQRQVAELKAIEISVSGKRAVDVRAEAISELALRISEIHHDLVALQTDGRGGIASNTSDRSRLQQDLGKFEVQLLGLQTLTKYLTAQSETQS